MLFDFDGPLVDLFAGHGAPGIAATLLEKIRAEVELAGTEFPDATDPHRIVAELHGVLTRCLLLSDEQASRLVDIAQRALVAEERIAAKSAAVTAGAAALVDELRRLGCGLAITSNNSAEAIHDFLAGRSGDGFREAFGRHVYGRAPEPYLMKPHPSCVRLALAGLGCTAESRILMIGDSASDFKAATAAELGIQFVGYAPNRRKIDLLRASGVDHLVESLHDLLRGRSF
ncbi:HAD family hydrolase [Streptacidiphilus sp. N1-12]|uniref:HAD family hydrolase n=2 Tax=Streptacidiphilus alkalitolerans TaxID=3342712 RepID=A0ABV6WM52_9ACTN